MLVFCVVVIRGGKNPCVFESTCSLADRLGDIVPIAKTDDVILAHSFVPLVCKSPPPLKVNLAADGL